MKKHTTYDRIQREIRNRYKNLKRRKGFKSLSPDEFKAMVLKIFEDFRLEITEGSQEQKWYKALMTNFGSKGGAKNAQRIKSEKTKKEIKYDQTELKL